MTIGMRAPLFVLLVASYAYFYQAGGWNQNSRFSLVRAITNEHSLRIDPFQASTGDKAVFEGHYYSDKAPGVAFAATPFVWAARPVLRLFGGDPESYGGIAFLSYLATILTSGLFTALAAVSLWKVCIGLGASEGGALVAALTYGLASPMWPLATLFLGHAISAACLVMAYTAAIAIGSERSPSTDRFIHDVYWTVGPPERDVLLGLVVGAGGGWATVSEFPAAVPAAAIAGLAALSAWPLGRARFTRIVSAVVAGALTCAAILMAYQYACFGSPFHIAYTSEQGFEAMQQGFFGIGTPTLERLRHILFGEYRGLLPLAPALAVAPLGLLILFVRTPPARAAAVVALFVAAYYVLLNASYTYWEGGWSYGPRHLSPAIPFLAIGLAVLWTVVSRPVRSVIGALVAVGAVFALVATTTMAQPPADIQRPLAQLLLPAFRDGDLALNTQRFTDGGANGGALRAHVAPKAAWNLGMRAGLSGHASLVPLVVVWIGCALWLSAAVRGPRARAGNRSPTSSPSRAPRSSP